MRHVLEKYLMWKVTVVASSTAVELVRQDLLSQVTVKSCHASKDSCLCLQTPQKPWQLCCRSAFEQALKQDLRSLGALQSSLTLLHRTVLLLRVGDVESL
eukprot:348656-Amphidinium_carterae.1